MIIIKSICVVCKGDFQKRNDSKKATCSPVCRKAKFKESRKGMRYVITKKTIARTERDIINGWVSKSLISGDNVSVFI